MKIDSFTDDQLLNLINNTILQKTDFKLDQFTGGAIQATATHKNKLQAFKVVLLFGYDSNNNSRSYQQKITKDTYYIWAKALILKVESVMVDDAGSDFNDLNAMMNTIPSEKKSDVLLDRDNKIEDREIGIITIDSNMNSTKEKTESELEADQVVDHLVTKIKTFKPNFRSSTATWCKDIEKAIRIDERSKDQLIGCIDWIYTAEKGAFWIPNILSGKKLRDKFDTMEMQMIGNNRTSGQVGNNLNMMDELRNKRSGKNGTA